MFKIKKQHILLLIILSFTLIPVQNLLGFEFPALYLLIPFWLVFLFFVLLGKIKVPKVSQIIILLFLLIIIEIFLSTFVGTVLAFNTFYFPNDVVHYVARFLVFVYFSISFYNDKIDLNFFVRSFLIILLLGMLIGVLQWLPWPGRELLLRLYPFQDGEDQFAQLQSDLHVVRIHGWAQHATANGGLAMLSFVFAISVFNYLKKFKILCSFIIILSVINIIISQARAGMLALVFAIILMYFVHIYLTKKPFKHTIKYIISVGFIIFLGRSLYHNGNPFIHRIIYRWDALFESSGGARVDQVDYGLSLLNSPLEYIFGISRTVQTRSNSVFHIEVEPFNIFILNGLFGFILQYGLILLILIYLFKNLRKMTYNPTITTLLVSSFVILSSYQMFSIAYFFYREIRVGLLPWVLIGVTIGAVEYFKRKKYFSNLEFNSTKQLL